MNLNKYRWVILLFISSASHAQESTDTSALINEFTKVMAFTSQPYLHYVTLTKMDAQPVLLPTDTVSVQGEFFKDSIEIYSNNGHDEMFLEDSLMVDIHNDRQMIWLHKVDVASKVKMNILPVNSKEMLASMKNNYSVVKTMIDKKHARLDFKTRKPANSTSSTTTTISLEYSDLDYLPQRIVISIDLKQAVDDEAEASLKQQGIDETKIVKTIDGIKYLIRKQTMTIDFTTIDHNKDRIKRIPSYTSVVHKDSAGDYKGVGKYEQYEITKAF